jgi:hypothetical protein
MQLNRNLLFRLILINMNLKMTGLMFSKYHFHKSYSLCKKNRIIKPYMQYLNKSNIEIILNNLSLVSFLIISHIKSEY